MGLWRRGRDLNSRIGCPISSFQDWHVRPLRHPSAACLSRHRVRIIALGEWICTSKSSTLFYPFHPAHVMTQRLPVLYAPIRLLVVFKDGHERATDGQSGPVESVDELCFRILLLPIGPLYRILARLA